MDKTTCIAFNELRKGLNSFFMGVKENEDVSKLVPYYTSLLQSVKEEVISTLEGAGFYKRDDGRIIISAPEVIIGNVDQNGVMFPGASTLTLRANKVEVECPTDGDGLENVGELSLRAPVIQSLAVNPGVDGCQNLVSNVSRISCQSKSLNLLSDSLGSCFVEEFPTSNGIHLLSHTDISLSANKLTGLKERVSPLVELVSSQIESLTDNIESLSVSIENSLKGLGQLQMETNELAEEDDMAITANIEDIDQNIDEFNNACIDLRKSMAFCEKKVRYLAELKRVGNFLKIIKDSSALDGGGTTGTSGIRISSNSVSIDAVDDMGMMSSNSAIALNTSNLTLGVPSGSVPDKLMSSIKLNAGNINIDATGEDEKGIKSLGTVNISAHDIILDSRDAEYLEEGNVSIPSGNIYLEAGNVVVDSRETKEGKVVGSFSVSARDISFDSVDLDVSNPEEIKEKELSAEGKISFAAKNIQIGNQPPMDENGEEQELEDTLKTETITMLSKNVVVDMRKPEDKFDILQTEKKDDDKALKVEVTGKNLTLEIPDDNQFSTKAGSVSVVAKNAIEIDGETTAKKKTTFEDEVEGKKVVKAQNLEASAGVKTPKIDK